MEFEANNPPSVFQYHIDRVNINVKAQSCRTTGRFIIVILDRSKLHLAHYIVSLAEKREPILKDAFLLLRQILPLRSTVLRLE